MNFQRPRLTRAERITLAVCLGGVLLLALASCGQSGDSREAEQGQMVVQGTVAGHAVALHVEHQKQTVGETRTQPTPPAWLNALVSSAARSATDSVGTILGGGGLLGGALAAALALWRKHQAEATLRETVAATEVWKQDETIPAGAKVALLDNLSRQMSRTSKQRVKRVRQAVQA